MKKTKVIKLGCLIDKQNMNLFMKQAWAARDYRKSLNFAEEILGYYWEDIQEQACPGITQQGYLTSGLNKKDLYWVSQNIIPQYYDKNGNLNKKVISPAKFDYKLAKSKLDLMRKERDNSKIYKDGLKKISELRNEVHKILYNEAQCHWGSCNDEKEAFNKSLNDVMRNRKNGLPSNIKRSGSPLSIRVQVRKSEGQDWKTITKNDNKGQFRLLSTEKNKRFIAKLCVGEDHEKNKQWVDVYAKFRGWKIPEDAKVKFVKLVAKQSGYSYKFHLCITVEGSWEQKNLQPKETVALDWGHREKNNGVLAFTWYGSDKDYGTINLGEVRSLIDTADKIREKRSIIFNNIKNSIYNIGKSRSHGKAIKLIKLQGVPTKAQLDWIYTEKKLRKHEDALRIKAFNKRKELYLKSIQDLKTKYNKFVFEDLKGESLKQMDKSGQGARRKRTNRDLVARYEFESLVGKDNIIKVDPYRTSKNCNTCMTTNNDLGSSEDFICMSCGYTENRDLNAAKNILLLGMFAQKLNNNTKIKIKQPKKGKLYSLREFQIQTNTPSCSQKVSV